MKSSLRLGSPPPKPLVIYDGQCRFCELWVQRWRSATGERVEYLPFQDEFFASRFPEVPRPAVEMAVHLLESDGAVYSGAEAALRALACAPHRLWLLNAYQRSPVFAALAERAYRFV